MKIPFDKIQASFKAQQGIAAGSAIAVFLAVIIAWTVSSIGERPGDEHQSQSAADIQTERPDTTRPETTAGVAKEQSIAVVKPEQTQAAAPTEAAAVETAPSKAPAPKTVATAAPSETPTLVTVATPAPTQSAPTAPEQAAYAEPAQAAQQVRSDLVRLAAYSLQRAIWNPLHFEPAIDTATNEQCLACHGEILARKVREASPAGLKASQALAWYQTLDTYADQQQTFHARHLTSDYAQKVMDLKCTFCHRGSDPREEAPNSSANAHAKGSFTLRKVVNPSKTCLLCHGKFGYEVMTGLEGPWHKVRQDLESEDAPNGCLTCHEETFRTVRHQVSYLKADAIEKLAKEGSSDICYGCHGGRAWYKISYPYPRHPWPGMEDVVEGTPEWAKDRATESDARYRLKK